MKKIITCVTALVALSLSPTLFAQGNGNGNGNAQGQQKMGASENAQMNGKKGQGKYGGEVRKAMRSSMKIVRESMKEGREGSKDVNKEFVTSLEGKEVSEIIELIKEQRSSQFEARSTSFKDALEQAEEHFKTEIEKIDGISEEDKTRAIERFTKIHEKHGKRSSEVQEKQIAFLDELGNDPDMTPEMLREKLQERRQEIKKQMKKQHKNGKNKKGKGKRQNRQNNN